MPSIFPSKNFHTLVLGLLTLGYGTVRAGAETHPRDTLVLKESVATATRRSAKVSEVPASVTILTRDQILAQTALSRDLGEMLGRLVPGMTPPSQSNSLVGQTLRGRPMLILIDGISQSTTRNVLRNLQTVDPASIERIEVVRGASEVYGDGGTGGVVNIITRVPRDGKLRSSTDFSAQSSFSDPADAMGGRIGQSFSGRLGTAGFLVNGSFNRTGAFFDAEGDLIPPDPHGQGGLSETDHWDLMGKLAWDWNNQLFQVSASTYRAAQSTSYTTDASANAQAAPGTAKSTARHGLELEEPQASTNDLLAADYAHYDLLGATVRGKAYFRQYMSRFFPFDGRAIASYQSISQSRLESTKLGASLSAERPLGTFGLAIAKPVLFLGVDYVKENTRQMATIFDTAIYNRSNGLRLEETGERLWVPEMAQHNLAFFGYADWKPVTSLLARAGLRYERIFVGVDDYTTLIGDPIEGGLLDYDALLLNAGLTWEFHSGIDLFAAFSQGFSLTDIGLTLRAAPAGTSVESLKPEATKVDNYEVGLRTRWKFARLAASLFYNQSEYGVTLARDFGRVRAPEKIHGAEFQADLEAGESLRFGGSLAYLEGEFKPVENQPYKPLNALRVSPPKATAYIEHVLKTGWFPGRWTNRVQALYSGYRKVFGASTAFAEHPIDDYALFDLISQMDLGRTQIRIGVENLLNEQYFPHMSQVMLNGNRSYTAARGATVSLGFAFNY